MTKIQAAIIGCGGRGNAHAEGYAASAETEIVAIVDPLHEAAQKLAKKYGTKNIYPDHRQMFAAHKPDIVSVCTWTGLHPEHVLDAAAAGVRAIHSEKPIAPTWGEAKKMHRACEQAGVQLTFCHQRRFEERFARARELAQDGAIGEIHRLEGFCSNLFDWGTHWFDMLNFYNGDTPVEWVMGQIDTTKVRSIFGVPVEESGLSYFRYANGVYGLLETGPRPGGRCSNRIVGSKGIIEVEPAGGPPLRMLRDSGSGWETPSLGGKSPKQDATVLSILNAIDCLKTGREPTLGSKNAMRATELIFATYESARRRARVDLPLDIEDSPLLSMLGLPVTMS